MRKPNADKRITSLSFSEKIEEKGNDNDSKSLDGRRQFRSHEAKKTQQDQQSMQEKASLNIMLTELIEAHNEKNSNKDFLWELILIDEKRTMAGIKVRMKCKHEPSGSYVIVRISFTLDYFQMARITEGNIFIEMDEINFQISNKEKRIFQADLQGLLRPFLQRQKYTDDESDSNRWVKELFVGVEKMLTERKLTSRGKKDCEAINRKQTLTNYILYHPPVSFAWSPKGNFCLTENKIPNNKNSFICTPSSFKFNVEVPKMSHLNTVNEEELAENHLEETEESLFDWDVKEEISILSFNKQNKQIPAFYRDKASLNSQNKTRPTNLTSSIKTDTMILQYSSKLTPTLRKIYERHFMKPEYMEVHRGDKLNVFGVFSDVKKYEDELLYLMEKINIESYHNVIEAVFGNTLSSYSGLLSGPNSVDQLRYFIVNEFIKQQKLKTPGDQINLALCLKSIILENEYFSIELQNYFKNAFRLFSRKSMQIYYLGSYFHFDEMKAESILMQLLKQYFKYLEESKVKDETSIQLVSKARPNLKKLIKVKSICRFPTFEIDWVLSDEYRKKAISTIVPLLMVRTRNFNHFEYKQIARIITANSKIVKFSKQLKQLFKSLQKYHEEEKQNPEKKSQNKEHNKFSQHSFFKNLLQEYSLYEQFKKQSDAVNMDVRRSFTIYCYKCGKASQTFEISEAERLKICNKCKVSQTRSH